MLSCESLKKSSGVLLYGDYSSLRELYDVVYDVIERTPFDNSDEGILLSFAYDIRKAYEKNREIIYFKNGFPENGTQYGVKIIWPSILLYSRILRVSLAYLDHSLRHQAAAYSLEAAIEGALKECFASRAGKIIASWHRIDPRYPKVLENLDSRGAVFCSWDKSTRNRLLASLLESLMYDNQLADFPDGFFDKWKNAEWPDPGW